MELEFFSQNERAQWLSGSRVPDLRKRSCGFKIRKTARFRNQYNQVPHLSQDTKLESTKITINITNKSQQVSPFPSGDHKHNKHKTLVSLRCVLEQDNPCLVLVQPRKACPEIT